MASHAGLLLAHMDEFGAISVYDVGCGDLAYCFGPEDEDDEDVDIMSHQGFAVGDSGFYLASAHDQDILMWQLESNSASFKGKLTAHASEVLQVQCSLNLNANTRRVACQHFYKMRQ